MAELRTQLVELLSGYRSHPDVEKNWFARAAGLAEVGHSCSRDHFEPGHFTASAFVLCPQRERLLLIYHNKLGRWLQPGGHIEPTDASLVASAQREVAEETGLVLDDSHLHVDGLFDLDIHSIPARGHEPEHEHFDLRFLFCAPSLDVSVGDGVGDVKWVALSEVATMPDRSVRRVARSLLQRGP